MASEIVWRVIKSEAEKESGLRAFLLSEEHEFFVTGAAVTDKLKVFKERELEKSLLLSGPELTFADYLIPLAQFKYLNIWEAVKCAALEAYNQAVALKISPLRLVLDAPPAAGFHKKALEGILLGAYAYEKFKSAGKDKEKAAFSPEVIFVVGDLELSQVEAELKKIEKVCLTVNRVRDLVNHPPAVLGPEEFADEAVKSAARWGLKIELWDENRLAKEGYNGLLAVGRGSCKPPRMVRLTYEPETAGADKIPHVVLVGKGITFDSGGLSLKPGASMVDMKSDMAGAAAVLGALEIIGQLGARVRVTGILALAENMPSGEAQVPGDIIVMKNGKSVEVKNTDAEGRLILVDALQLGASLQPDYMVDAATLTGACRVALGIQMAAVLGRDRDLIDRLKKSGEESGEIIWELPLEKAYLEDMKSDFADISNIGNSAYGGTITASLFLSEFVPEEIPWAHLDIAGPAYPGKKWKYFAPGATGFGARLMAGLVKNLSE
ncbi:MAG: leucyl aminopeptidase [Deltaproteobacteria bacterium]|nr:leucyl aminopeptidase [Deltaproteobacteria bacterium]